MRSGSKKTLIIVIIIILVLAVVGATFGYLYFATDAFKSSKELFSKYISQNIDAVKNMMTSNVYEEYNIRKSEKNYESNATISMSYSEGGEISNPMNGLSAKLDVQRNIDDNYCYADGQVLYNGEEYIEIEAVQDDNIYGIRFSDVVKQFVAVRDEMRAEEVADDLGVEISELEILFDILNGNQKATEEILSTEERNVLKERYFNIIKENISNATFSKLKKSMITVNNNTIEANAYIATMSYEQVRTMLVQLLNTLKSDEIILEKIRMSGEEETFLTYIDDMIEKVTDYEKMPELKITVYEQKGITVSTVIEVSNNKIVIENSSNQIKIQRNVLNTEQEEQQTLIINRVNNGTEETYNIQLNIIEGDTEADIAFINRIAVNDTNLTYNMELNYVEGIKKWAINLDSIIKMTDYIEKKQELDDNNNVILNDLSPENRKAVLEKVITSVSEKLTTRLNLLMQELKIEFPSDEENPVEQQPSNEFEMPSIEINKFNSKVEFYTGESVSAENVKALLEIVRSNLNSVEFIPVENEENTEQTNNNEEMKQDIKLYIEKDKENSDLVDQILDKIDDRTKYKVSISYKSESGIINYIMISEME